MPMSEAQRRARAQRVALDDGKDPQIERLPNVLYVGRPADGSSEATVGLFVLGPDGHTATRTPVKLGRGSVNTIEVLSGLKVGDQVILSEMSRWDAVARVRLQ